MPRKKNNDVFDEEFSDNDSVESEPSGEDEFIVEKLVDKRYNAERGTYQWYVKWKNWPDDQNTWEDDENVNNCDLLRSEYEEEKKRKREKEAERKRKLHRSPSPLEDFIVTNRSDSVGPSKKKPPLTESKLDSMKPTSSSRARGRGRGRGRGSGRSLAKREPSPRRSLSRTEIVSKKESPSKRIVLSDDSSNDDDDGGEDAEVQPAPTSSTKKVISKKATSKQKVPVLKLKRPQPNKASSMESTSSGKTTEVSDNNKSKSTSAKKSKSQETITNSASTTSSALQQSKSENKLLEMDSQTQDSSSNLPDSQDFEFENATTLELAPSNAEESYQATVVEPEVSTSQNIASEKPGPSQGFDFDNYEEEPPDDGTPIDMTSVYYKEIPPGGECGFDRGCKMEKILGFTHRAVDGVACGIVKFEAFKYPQQIPVDIIKKHEGLAFIEAFEEIVLNPRLRKLPKA